MFVALKRLTNVAISSGFNPLRVGRRPGPYSSIVRNAAVTLVAAAASVVALTDRYSPIAR